MSWNYRLVHMKGVSEVCLGLFEVFYDEQGRPNASGADPIIVGDDIEEIQQDLKWMREALGKPILEDEFWLKNRPEEQGK